ncbi:MAG: YceI family protein [Bacteroidota bacterium]
MKKIITLVTTIIVLSSFVLLETTWTQDKMHTQLHFGATHFGISQVEGVFQSFTVNMKSEKKDFSDAEIEMTADIKSINTQVEYRDNDLRGSNWFDAEKYPTLAFKSTSFKKMNGTNYKLKGDFTMHGITKPVEFDATFNGWAVTMTKKNTAGFTVKGKVKRSDFNLGGTPALTGVSDEIKVWANVELGEN